MPQYAIKTARAKFKAAGDAPVGTFEAIVSVFGNVDLGGDRVMPGAFTRTLSAWKESGDRIPVIWSHDWDDPMSHIGYVEDAEERPEGLWVKGVLDVENNPRAAYVARLLKERRVREFSFGYFADDFAVVDDPDHGSVRELRSIDLFEVGPTLLGMNPETVLLEAASAVSGSKAGRVLSSKNEQALAEARNLIDEVLASVRDEKAGAKSRKATADEVSEGVFVRWDTSGGTAQGRIEHVMTEGVLGVPGSDFQLNATAEDPALLIRIFRPVEDGGGWEETETLVGHRASTVRVIDPLPMAETESKAAQTKIPTPEWMQANARQGLDWYAEGLAGDGVTEQTVAEARAMAGGNVSEDKAQRMAAWFARHMTDLDAPAADPSSDDFPSPGVVAHALWGGGTRNESERAMAWAQRQSGAESAGKAWTVGASRDLEIVERDVWDGDAAAARVFAWAGFDGDNPDPARARRAFLVYDDEAPELRGSYKLGFADVIDGELYAVDAGLRAAASRLPQTDASPDALERARLVLDAYFARLENDDDDVEDSASVAKSRDNRSTITSEDLLRVLVRTRH